MDLFDDENKFKRCLGCSFRTIEYKQYNHCKNGYCYQKTKIGLECYNCKQVVCKDCVCDLALSISKKRNDIHPDFESYANDVMYYEKNGPLQQPNQFIGHCCLINNQRKQNDVRKLKTSNESQNTEGKGMFINILI